MSPGIYLLQDGKLVAMRESGFLAEDLLQQLIADYPDLLAGDQVDADSPRRWLLVSRELAVPDAEGAGGRWSLDHLFLDQDGTPTLVEVKRSSDHRIRREVVGQMLDYAANAVAYWPVQEIQEALARRCAAEGKDPDQQLAALIGDASPEEFWKKVKARLQSGQIRMLFVADRIPRELRRIVEFLNQQMTSAEVLAVEVRQYVGDGGTRSIVPRVFGQTEEAAQVKSAGRAETRQWDEATFFAELAARHGESAASTARRFLAWAHDEQRLQIWWGRGARSGSFVPTLEHRGEKHQLFAVWTYGVVEIYFYWYGYKAPFRSPERRKEILDRLNAISGISLPEEAIHKRPSIPLASLQDERNLAALLDVFRWVLEEIRGSERR